MEKFLVKLNRFSAWALLILIILFIISGYGMTKQIIDPVFATQLHDNILPIFLFLFFVVHVAISSSYALRRWKVFSSTKAANIYAFIFGLIMLIIFLWLYLL